MQNRGVSITHIIIALSVFGLLMGTFALAKQSAPLGAPVRIPQTPQDIQTFLGKLWNALSGALGEVWKEIVNLWRKAKEFWNSYILPKLLAFWEWLKGLFGKEAQKRGPVIQERFQKQEKSFWEMLPKAWEGVKTIWGQAQKLWK